MQMTGCQLVETWRFLGKGVVVGVEKHGRSVWQMTRGRRMCRNTVLGGLALWGTVQPVQARKYGRYTDEDDDETS
jgi:hypothetical protein